jgi:hypothetical protein
VFGVQPSYSGPEVSGQHYSYGPQVPREITDLGDGRIMVEQRAAGAGPVLISPATARPSLWQRLAGKLRAKAHDYRQALWWAERGLSIYGSDCARPEYVEDLRKRAARYRAKLGPT